ncbi:chloride channel protein [Nitratireductor pacificus]|uniref:Chloride transporter ClC family protein n=1 Tax=Nitratireductor pacificus pht-3B TaxID=391937 RepID=K2MTV2_9HYPH|nr:chloride channel protein [Nitratireductor pacificus]EKF20827.1 chloride transporter ClC family protein [Nitratireductor pacificus pht-3B]
MLTARIEAAFRLIQRLPRVVWTWVEPNLNAFLEARLPLIWLLSLLLGLGVAVAAIVFRELIGIFQLFWLGTSSELVFSAAQSLPWYWIMAGPTVGGLLVGLLLTRLEARRTGAVADVIEARALSGRKLSLRQGLLSAFVTALSLGSGASAGREGPVVHLGAVLATAIAWRASLPEWGRRTLLGAGVATAISASFNAPIAGVLFAHEVILGHYAMRSFVPIVIASAAGAVVSRLWFGSAAAFLVPTHQITSFWEFPAFALLGVTAAVVAILFQFALFAAEYAARAIHIPLWTRPLAGGILVGGIAVVFPQVLGVGYEITDMALWNQLPLAIMLALIVVKTVATAITLAMRFGGGIFSPALLLGALTGGAFGIIAASVFPTMASSQGLYAILGMGAVAGAVLGAPISTTVIVFELTGGYELSIALLLTVAVAHGINQATHGHSWFQWQLEMRGLFLVEGPHRALGQVTRVMDFMEVLDDDAEPVTHDPETGAQALKPTDTLEAALRAFDKGGHDRLPVVDPADNTRVIAFASHVRALRSFNKALVELSEEEHR